MLAAVMEWRDAVLKIWLKEFIKRHIMNKPTYCECGFYGIDCINPACKRGYD